MQRAVGTQGEAGEAVLRNAAACHTARCTEVWGEISEKLPSWLAEVAPSRHTRPWQPAATTGSRLAAALQSESTSVTVVFWGTRVPEM
jgi:hypothetical protein